MVVKVKCGLLLREGTMASLYLFRTMDLALLPTNCRTCSSVSTGRAMGVDSILVAPALDWLFAKHSSKLMEASFGRRAVCREPLFRSYCRLSRLPLPQYPLIWQRRS